MTGCACGETGDRISELYYHRKWWDFTQKLRKLMEEYSTLPVVVPYQLGMNDGTLDCSVADVHDHKTGKFRERIITIHDVKDSFSANINDDYLDLPL